MKTIFSFKKIDLKFGWFSPNFLVENTGFAYILYKNKNQIGPKFLGIIGHHDQYQFTENLTPYISFTECL